MLLHSFYVIKYIFFKWYNLMNPDNQIFIESTLENVNARITQVEIALNASKSIGITENN